MTMGWRGVARGIALAAALLPVGAAQAGFVTEGTGPEGFWMNPRGTVAVRTGACGAHLCGGIVWASAEARADARDSGVDPLVGVQLLEDYRPLGSGAWAGTVFVPDMGRRFASRIEQSEPDHMVVKGCVLGGLLCKSQTWRRIGQPPHA